jgi:recombination protein RecA
MSKKKSEEVAKIVGNYFTEDKPKEFIHSGCTLLDCVLGGGYPLGRVVNIVGDKSSNKTGLAIEAFANFNIQFPEGTMYYHEAEAAFDIDYAKTLGMPVDKVSFVEGNTIEELFNSLDSVCKFHRENNTPGLYVIDSLDALSDKAEKERDIGEGSFGAAKAKKLSELFRRLISDIEKTMVCLIVISQVRDNIGITFGSKHTRSGGRALDFYASQIVWLAEIKKITKTVKGVERPTGAWIRAKCKKNKISLPFRECDFPILFGFGVDSILANLVWLKDIKGGLEGLEIDPKTINSLSTKIIEEQDFSYMNKLESYTKDLWYETEKDFLPKSRKY